MRNFLFILTALILTSPAQANRAHIVEVKEDIQLTDFDQGYDGSKSFCFDMKKKTLIEIQNCRSEKNKSLRLCQVFAYNLRGAFPKSHIEKGTTFFVTKQFGPKTTQDWDSSTALFKVFTNATGKDEISNPNLIVECTQTKRGLNGLKNFSVKEISAALKSIVEIK